MDARISPCVFRGIRIPVDLEDMPIADGASSDSEPDSGSDPGSASALGFGSGIGTFGSGSGSGSGSDSKSNPGSDTDLDPDFGSGSAAAAAASTAAAASAATGLDFLRGNTRGNAGSMNRLPLTTADFCMIGVWRGSKLGTKEKEKNEKNEKKRERKRKEEKSIKVICRQRSKLEKRGIGFVSVC